MEATKALVTGANGFIGSHLVEYLHGNGWAVRCLVRRDSDLRWIEHLALTYTYGDLRDRASLEQAVQDREVVFHLAAQVRATDYDSFYNTNCMGTRNLVKACVGKNPNLKRFVHVSSMAVAGPSEKPELRNEDGPCNPYNDYGRTKLLGEEEVREHGKTIPCVIVRPPNVYGPREREVYSILKIVQKRLKPLFGTGERQTTLCHVYDLVRGMVLAATSPRAVGRTYYITDGTTHSYREIADLIARQLGVSGFLVPLPHQALLLIVMLMSVIGFLTGKPPFLTMERLREVRRTYLLFNGSRAERDLGYRPIVGLEEGIRNTIAWYRQNGLLD
jgi:nucleoside-diphosphate-sugar epimerase